MVTVALDLYFKSTSLRKIVDHLDQFYERHLHHTTILFWASVHIRADGLKARTNNNKVERLHNTVRERQKVMRGLQNDETSTEFNNGFRTFYNHIRPHMALGGETPGQAAGLDLKLGRNRWLGMIQKSIKALQE